MAKHMHAINLLPNKGDSVVTQFLNWALSIGRLLIILVEMLALGTFLYRFTIDWQIVDLRDKIKVQKSIVTSFQAQEESFRNLQDRLALIKSVDAQSTNTPNLLNDVIEMGRGYITFRNFHLTTKDIKIEAQASTTGPLSTFVNTLKSHPMIESISIDKVESNTTSGQIIIGITAMLVIDESLISPAEEQADADAVQDVQAPDFVE